MGSSSSRRDPKRARKPKFARHDKAPELHFRFWGPQQNALEPTLGRIEGFERMYETEKNRRLSSRSIRPRPLRRLAGTVRDWLAGK